MKAEILTRTDVHRLLRACTHNDDNRHDRGKLGHRNAALLATLYRTGLRIGEALALALVDVDQHHHELRVRRGKGGRARVVAFDVELMAIIDRWLVRRTELGAKRIDPLFCTGACGPLTTRYVRALLPRLADRAGLHRRVHAHALRHAYAAELVRDGVPETQISALLGHSSLAVTHRYLAGVVSSAELRRTVRARPTWR